MFKANWMLNLIQIINVVTKRRFLDIRKTFVRLWASLSWSYPSKSILDASRFEIEMLRSRWGARKKTIMNSIQGLFHTILLIRIAISHGDCWIMMGGMNGVQIAKNAQLDVGPLWAERIVGPRLLAAVQMVLLRWDCMFWHLLQSDAIYRIIG